MDRPSAKNREIDLLDPDEVRRLMAACSRRAPTGIRNRALIALLYGSGLRVGEAIALRPKDLDLDGLAVTVQAGKGDKRRVAALLPDAVDAIQRWGDRRAAAGVGARAPYFCTLAHAAAGPLPTEPGGALAREYVARVLKRLARRAGIDKRVHPHGLRHSHADLLRRRGFDMQQIRKQLGHASLEITGRYLDHLGSNDLSERMRTIGAVLTPTPPEASLAKELHALLERLPTTVVAQLISIVSRRMPG
ncbi:MAG: tyrosine-type recombinase/integrase [Planctomycetes bacterium]|nr:tyrosine-type recombinase/integrase [Planctomycetota bacterium]